MLQEWEYFCVLCREVNMINMLADTYTDSSTNQCGTLAYLLLSHSICTANTDSVFNYIFNDNFLH